MRGVFRPILFVMATAVGGASCTPVVVLPDIANIPYGSDHARQKLDIYFPHEGSGPVPVIVYIHGGGWETGDKSAAILAAGKLLEHGFAVAAINYRLSQQAIFPAQIHDCKAAVRWVRANAETYGFDPERIGVWGASAGGHLAALLGTSGDVAELEGEVGEPAAVSSRVQAVADYNGPTDLLNIAQDVTYPPGNVMAYDDVNSVISHLFGLLVIAQGIEGLRLPDFGMGPTLEEKRVLLSLANPITHITDDDPPFFIAHGTADTVVPLSQSTKLAEALDAKRIPNTYDAVSGAGHVLPPRLDDEVVDFFQQRLGGSR